MFRQGKKVIAGFAALCALGLGVGAVTQAGQSASQPARAAAAVGKPAPESASAPDTDNVQSGDQSTPDRSSRQAKFSGARSVGSTAPAVAKSQTGDQSTPDTPGSSEKPDSSGEKPDSTDETGSEAPNNDGPRGHADEPGNSNADHQFNGQE